LSGYFDQRPVLCENAAIVDRDDRSAQAVFTARLGGQPVLGIALCVAGPQEGYLAAVFDRADQPLRPALGALVQAALEATPRAVVWQEVPMPDGRGSVKLPKDWKILSSAQGTLVAMSAAEGSDLGMAVELGQAFPVQTPEGFAKVTLPAGPNGPMDRRNYPVALQGDPAQAMESLLNGFFSSYSEMKGGPPLRFGRLIVAESVPPAISNAQSAYLYFQSERGKPPAAQARQSLALITTAPLSQDTWMFYYSMVSAPAETFFRDLPILEEIWRSWRAADWVHAGRITAALDSQKAAGGIWRAYYESQQQLGPRTLDAWSEWTGQVHASIQPQTGEIQDLRLAWVDDLLGRLSQREGADRYRKLTPGELKY
jgi:hypothetical protein